MPPRQPKYPKKYRVLWTDAADEGRYTDVDAHSDAEAAWKVMREHAETTSGGVISASFTGIMPVPADEAAR